MVFVIGKKRKLIVRRKTLKKLKKV